MQHTKDVYGLVILQKWFKNIADYKIKYGIFTSHDVQTRY